jgi:Family of unknown function (DUF6130)
MFAALTARAGRSILTASAVATISVLVLFTTIGGQALPSAEAEGPAAPAMMAERPPAKIIVDSPKPEPLARGVAILQFRTENLQIVPVFGPSAAAISPRIGHLHITLDDAPWHWVHTSNDPVIVADLTPGPHKILFELADANHKVLGQEVVKFEVPRPVGGAVEHRHPE